MTRLEDAARRAYCAMQDALAIDAIGKDVKFVRGDWAALVESERQNWVIVASAARKRPEAKAKPQPFFYTLDGGKIHRVQAINARLYKWNRRLVRFPDGAERYRSLSSLHPTAKACAHAEIREAARLVRTFQANTRQAERRLAKARKLRVAVHSRKAKLVPRG